MDLRSFQAEHREWRDRNFPVFRDTDGLLGVVEEVGELSHAVLKSAQGIRGEEAEHRAAEEDAVGDIIIFLASHCNTRDIDMAACLERAWDEVKQRDWIKNQQDGVSA